MFLVLGAGGFSLYAFQQTRNIHKNEAPEDWDQALQILKCERALMDWDHSLRRLVMATGSTRFASRLEAMQTQRSGNNLDCLNKLAERENHKLYLQSAKNHFERWRKRATRLLSRPREGPIAEAQESLIKRWEPTQVLLYQDLLGLVLSYRSDTKIGIKRQQIKLRIRDRVGLVIAISLLLTLFVAWRTGERSAVAYCISDGLSTLLGQDVEVSDSPATGGPNVSGRSPPSPHCTEPSRQP